MTLVENWRAVAHKAWSMRFLYLSVALSTADQCVAYFAPEYPSRAFGLAATLLCLAAGISRVVAQPRMHE